MAGEPDSLEGLLFFVRFKRPDSALSRDMAVAAPRFLQ